LIALIAGIFMSLQDTPMVTLALPTIQRSLHTDLSTASWVLGAYLLGFAVLLITIGRLADQYGRKRIFLLSLVLFSVGSLSCALSLWFGQLTRTPALFWLLIARVMQALGSAGLTPISFAIINAIFPVRTRGTAIGIWVMSGGLTQALGPLLGGFLLRYLDWRWIFFVELPCCAIGLFMVFFFVPETHVAQTSKRIDLPGIVTLTGALCSLMLALMQGNIWGWTSSSILLLFAGACLGLLFCAIVEVFQRRNEPMVDFSLFRSARFRGATITMFLFQISVQGASLILVLYLVNALGYEQLQAAYTLLPMPLAIMVSAAALGRLSRHVHPSLFGVLGLFLLAGAYVLLCLRPGGLSSPSLLWCMILLGIGQGMLFQSQQHLALSDMPSSRLGVASGVFNTIAQIGAVLGVGILMSLGVGHIPSHLNQAHAASMITVREQVERAYQTCWWVAAGIAFAAILPALVNFLACRTAPEISKQENEAQEAKVSGRKTIPPKPLHVSRW
jgi:EmrB/QacA subfamily drug resistance transporter